MKKVIVIGLVIAVINLTACTQPDKSIEILQNQGYTNIQIEGYDAFGCSEDDVYRTKFSATKGNGTVYGVVCSGLLKGSTIRLYN